MRVRAIDASGDWQFGKGKQDYKQNFAALSQNIKTRILSFLGDCFFDLEAGIDWFNLLGSKDRTALELAISTTILNTEGVTGIRLIDVTETPGRLMTVRYRVQSTLGEIGDVFQYDTSSLG